MAKCDKELIKRFVQDHLTKVREIIDSGEVKLMGNYTLSKKMKDNNEQESKMDIDEHNAKRVNQLEDQYQDELNEAMATGDYMLLEKMKDNNEQGKENAK